MAGETPKKKRPRGGGFASNPELAKEAGRKGGLKVRDKYGSERYADIGRQGGETVRERYGSDYFREIGSKGGKISTKGGKAKDAEPHEDQGAQEAPEPQEGPESQADAEPTEGAP